MVEIQSNFSRPNAKPLLVVRNKNYFLSRFNISFCSLSSVFLYLSSVLISLISNQIKIPTTIIVSDSTIIFTIAQHKFYAMVAECMSCSLCIILMLLFIVKFSLYFPPHRKAYEALVAIATFIFQIRFSGNIFILFFFHTTNMRYFFLFVTIYI